MKKKDKRGITILRGRGMVDDDTIHVEVSPEVKPLKKALELSADDYRAVREIKGVLTTYGLFLRAVKSKPMQPPGQFEIIKSGEGEHLKMVDYLRIVHQTGFRPEQLVTLVQQKCVDLIVHEGF